MTDARQAYLESRILTADPLELIRMLYREALRAVGEARRFLAAGEILARGREISRAVEILTELALNLDRKQGSGIAHNLAELYDYMQRRLLEAQFQQSDGPLVEVSHLLSEMLEAWERCRPAQPEAEEPAFLPSGEQAADYTPLSCCY